MVSEIPFGIHGALRFLHSTMAVAWRMLRSSSSSSSRKIGESFTHWINVQNIWLKRSVERERLALCTEKSNPQFYNFQIIRIR